MPFRHLAGVIAGLLLLQLVHGAPVHGRRPRVAEARLHLGSIRTAMESFRATEDGYVAIAPEPAGAPAPSPRAWEVKPCSEACRRGNLDACTTFDCIGFAPSGRVRYVYACETIVREDIPDFTCAAVGDLDGDGKLGVLVYGTANGVDRASHPAIVAPLPAIARASGCAAGTTPAFEIVECTPGVF